MNDSCRLVFQPLTRLQQPTAKLGVLVVADLAVRPRPQISSEHTVLLEQPPMKGHIGAKWRVGERTCFRPPIEHHQRGHPVPLFLRKPGWRCAGPLGKDTPPGARPLAAAQSGCEILQPGRLHGHVVIHKGKNVAPSLTNAGVEGIRLSLIRLEQITEATGVSGAEVSYDGGGLVARIVVDYQDLPLNRLGKRGSGNTTEGFFQSPATVICAYNDCNVHVFRYTSWYCRTIGIEDVFLR